MEHTVNVVNWLHTIYQLVLISKQEKSIKFEYAQQEPNELWHQVLKSGQVLKFQITIAKLLFWNSWMALQHR